MNDKPITTKNVHSQVCCEINGLERLLAEVERHEKRAFDEMKWALAGHSMGHREGQHEAYRHVSSMLRFFVKNGRWP
mgnify:CR=1 FL=1